MIVFRNIFNTNGPVISNPIIKIIEIEKNVFASPVKNWV